MNSTLALKVSFKAIMSLIHSRLRYKHWTTSNTFILSVEMSINIEVIETGTIRIKPSPKTKSANRPILWCRLMVFTDRSCTEPLPINTYLINCPEGRILFHCGESPHTMKPGYFPVWMPFFHVAVNIHVRPHEGSGAWSKERGTESKDLKAVVRSQLHHGHGDRLPSFIGWPIYDSQEYGTSTSILSKRPWRVPFPTNGRRAAFLQSYSRRVDPLGLGNEVILSQVMEWWSRRALLVMSLVISRWLSLGIMWPTFRRRCYLRSRIAWSGSNGWRQWQSTLGNRVHQEDQGICPQGKGCFIASSWSRCRSPARWGRFLQPKHESEPRMNVYVYLKGCGKLGSFR